MPDKLLHPPAERRRAAAHLKAARTLLNRDRGWTQGAFARDGKGSPVDTRDEQALSFCATGAIFATEDPAVGSLQARTALRAAVTSDLETWNDAPDRILADVLGAFDRAVALIEAEDG